MNQPLLRKKSSIDISDDKVKYPNMPPKYLKFTKKEKTWWLWFNLILMII